MGLPRGADAAIDRQQQFDAMEEELLGAAIPMHWSTSTRRRCRRLGGDEATGDLEQLRALTRALEEAGYLERDGDRLDLTPRAARKLGMRALTDIFSRLRRESLGGHALPTVGAAAASRPTRPSRSSTATRSPST